MQKKPDAKNHFKSCHNLPRFLNPLFFLTLSHYSVAHFARSPMHRKRRFAGISSLHICCPSSSTPYRQSCCNASKRILSLYVPCLLPRFPCIRCYKFLVPLRRSAAWAILINRLTHESIFCYFLGIPNNTQNIKICLLFQPLYACCLCRLCSGMT